MSRETLFSYLAAFVTVVLALALTDLVQSLHRLLRARERVRWDTLPLLAATYSYVIVISEFFTLWDGMQVGVLTFAGLIGALVTPSLIALAAFVSLPDEMPAEGIDLHAFYDRDRGYFALVLILANLTDVIRLSVFYGIGVLTLKHFMLPILGAVQIGAFALIWRAERRWLQLLAYAILFAAAGFSFFNWTIRAG